ncbi:MAG: transglycosylase domain-containing protein [Megasphaera sp.]|jgi:membrane peptidoglycan carboxypeptidase|uniref:transglycosylase domain-containing protein n=1 Tax=Megasphaera sueciensis TaxID=349094 RepID=UPI003CFFD5CB|nr:transglycosylase domain-containing protein [Megasphaera sp.]MCI1822897.1 transglycosylase domain-containing protein [Megasphaera sp.]
MKKKYIFIFLIAFFACAGWNILYDTPKINTHIPVVSSHVQKSTLPEPITTLQENLYSYIHFRTALDDKIKKIPIYTSLSVIPKSLQQAVIATEDRRFYEHGPIDPIGIIRAMLVNFTSGETVEGGSTISQQVVKNNFLTPERTLTRKSQELILSILLERNYTKDEILELYLNTAYFGSNSYGIHDACLRYFDIKPDNLSLGQSTMLAGLLQAPTYYNPLENYKAAKERQKTVLALMSDQGFITPAEATAAYRENLHLKKNK